MRVVRLESRLLGKRSREGRACGAALGESRKVGVGWEGAAGFMACLFFRRQGERAKRQPAVAEEEGFHAKEVSPLFCLSVCLRSREEPASHEAGMVVGLENS